MNKYKSTHKIYKFSKIMIKNSNYDIISKERRVNQVMFNIKFNICFKRFKLPFKRI